MIDTSKVFANAIKNLYLKKAWLVDYAILKAKEWNERGNINAIDYEELITYLAEEQTRQMQEITEEVQATEVVETVDNTEESEEENDAN